MKKKSSLKNKFLTLAVLATVMGGSVFMPRANAEKVNIVAQTSGGSYRTNIAETTRSQASKDAPITLGNQINFGTYQQSLSLGTISAASLGPHAAKYSASDGATFNRDPVAWIVVKDNGSNKYTLVSTKVLDGGVSFDTAGGQKWSSSSMRDWMNDTTSSGMLGKMFTAKEQALLQAQNTETYGYTSGETGYNGWDDSTSTDTSKGYNVSTGDKLWLLSVQELHEWFKNTPDTNPKAGSGNEYPSGGNVTGKVPWGAGATDYAKSKGIWIEWDGGVTAVDGSLNADYLLRSPSSLYADDVRSSSTYGAVGSDDATYAGNGARPAMQIDLSSLPLIFTSKSSYDYHYGTAGESKFTAGKGSAELGGAAAKFETISAGSAGTPGDVLDLTLYDSSLGVPNVTTNTSLELNGANMKLGYSGASTDYKTAGMLATGDATSGYAPEGWALLSNKTGTGDMVVGLANMDADTNYQLLMFNEQGDGTSFIGDAAYAFDGFKKNSGGKFELDLTTTNNASKTFSGAITIGTGNKLMAKASQLTGGTTVTSTNDGTIVLKDGGTISFAINESASADGTLILDLGSASNKTLVFNGSTIANKVLVKNGSSLDPSADVFTDTVYL
ncbi:MAG: DUF6273 domain-containing protein [Acidaminococcaceae bacterium]|nr:DUF6273 domain-containing protein [Acidaminococcaceae bacterium]